MKLDNSIEKIFEELNKMNGNSSDIVTRIIEKSNRKIGYIYLESVSSDDKISNFLNKAIVNMNKKKPFDSFYDLIQNSIFNSKVKSIETYEDMYYHLASGFTVIVIDKCDKAIVVETRQKLDRGVTESTSETITRGPKDSFTENHNMNLGLIRKRIKDPNLWYEEVKVGRRTKSKVTVAYIKDIVPNYKVRKILDELNKIDIDAVIDTGYIRELLEKEQKSVFPKVISTERPDFACTSLLNGKIVILVENSPFVIILPAVLTDFFHSPEDNYQKPLNVSFSRILRGICFFLALLTPAIYIALMTFNQEIIPDQLLISLAIQRDGVPFPSAIEVLLFVLTFEVLREADIHSPSFSGSAMNVVGALILGDAAVAAGIVSPIVIIIVAATSISELVFYDVDVIDAIREWRLLFIIAATFMGLIGFVAIFIIFIAKLTSLECLGTPYLTPFSPLNIRSLKDSIIRVSRKKLKERPEYLTKNLKRLDDNYEESNS
ncbi:MAG: spore germination protein [Firmicutes bacterium]|nr:spore germination protein [Bacillota bacterium]